MMNENKRIISLVWKISILCLIVLAFVVINKRIDMQNAKKHEENGDYNSQNECVRTLDCAPFFDENPLAKFLISFDAKASKPGEISVYQQNGSSSRYEFSYTISVSTEYQHYDLVVEPILVDDTITASYLSFYGEYGTGVCSII